MAKMGRPRVESDDLRRYKRPPKYRPIADRFPSEREMLESLDRHWGSAPQNVQCNPSVYASRAHRVSHGARSD